MEKLVVESKVRKFVKEASGMNTSASAFEALNKLIHDACTSACEKAKSDGRKTVMDRDFS
ncbi:hypothetical protein COB21_03300 [Candidatus Aerophobetes bacterium]|uniref:Transcription factor CBF/NF-Y/archaeal histone domain-containing protein n=1 Tax=Aerophobetes bacterium TaxID=2030807 RepID=A0A2A4X5H8_UNCAE|nr:MAG: hypothetical protein COB21_03300 [Candidatus Aerophobetes bacterium]